MSNVPAIIPIQKSVVNSAQIQTVNARELHAFLGNKDMFANWIKDRIEQFGFVENQDFVTYLENTKKGRPSKEYALTLSMGKELSMVERNQKGKEARQYFIACEEKAKAPTYNDPIIMLRMEQIAMQQQIEAVTAKVDSLRPQMSLASVNGIQGLIATAAKWYRMAMQVKHIRLSINEAKIHFQVLLLERFGVTDINYIGEVGKAYGILKQEEKRYRNEYQAWIDRNNLFTGGTA